jgi:hypothetical protein
VLRHPETTQAPSICKSGDQREDHPPSVEISIGEWLDRLADRLGLVTERPPSASGSAWALLSPKQRGGWSRYRYAYALWWGKSARPTLGESVAWVLLNPIGSDSIEKRRRPTLGYCRHRTREWGYGGLVIINLFAYRADRPEALDLLPRPVAVGPANDRVLKELSRACAVTVAAWGGRGSLWGRSQEARRLIDNLHCVAHGDGDGPVVTGHGEPCHPRRLPGNGTLSRLL